MGNALHIIKVCGALLIYSIEWIFAGREDLTFGDLKGSNVLLGLHGQCILTDMGTAFIAGRTGDRASDETMKMYGKEEKIEI